jgi:N-dimethylarginine dimethylaminohydrolase
MSGSVKKILMCPPDFFEISYEINPWMHTEIQAKNDLAKTQWQNLFETVKSLDVDVKLVDPVQNLPDLVFIDAGFLYKNVFIPSNFTYPERQGESIHFEKWFRENGYEIRKLDTDLKFEGHGDNLWAGENKVFCGNGFRSQKESFEKIKNILSDVGDFELINVDLIDNRFYHLDTCFCPLSEDLALVYPEAISEESYEGLKKQIRLIEIDSENATKFACNSLVIGKDVVMPAGNDKVAEELVKYGFKTHQVDVTEFMKSGGACKCMCMPV